MGYLKYLLIIILAVAAVIVIARLFPPDVVKFVDGLFAQNRVAGGGIFSANVSALTGPAAGSGMLAGLARYCSRSTGECLPANDLSFHLLVYSGDGARKLEALKVATSGVFRTALLPGTYLLRTDLSDAESDPALPGYVLLRTGVTAELNLTFYRP